MLIYIDEQLGEGEMVSLSQTDFIMGTRFTLKSLRRTIKSLCSKGLLSQTSKAGHPIQYGIPLGDGQLTTPSQKTTPSVELQPLVADDAPEYYHILRSMEGFSVALDKCEWWRERKNISLEQAEDAAVGMKSVLNRNGTGQWIYVDRTGRKRHYSDLWTTFQNWAKRGEKSQSNFAKYGY